MKKNVVLVFFALIISAQFISCGKKQTPAANYVEPAQTVSDASASADADAIRQTTEAYSDAIKQASEAYSDAVESVSSDLKEITDMTKSVLPDLGSIMDAANAAANLAGAAGSSTKSSSSSNADWKKALDDYEQFVDDYVDFMKKYKANPTDLSLLADYASMSQKALSASDSISKMQGDLAGSDVAEFTTRYTRIAAKMASAL